MTESKLASRKLWVAIGGLLTVIAVELLGIDTVSAEHIVGAVIFIVPAYIGGQGIVDAVKAYTSRIISVEPALQKD